MAAYYNEIDPFAARWLRNLIAAGHIAAGDVDERSIEDVKPDDLRGYTQCHFFAGIAGWSLALRLAGWDDARPVWTGSCPCQPFSAAGKGRAADDERHLWPAWFSLIRECRPAIVFGEQVEAAIGWGWLDVVFADLEGEGHACGAAVLPACSVGAPHIRNRLWWVADADGGNARAEWLQRGRQHRLVAQDGDAVGQGFLGDADGEQDDAAEPRQPLSGAGRAGGVADASRGAGARERRVLAADAVRQGQQGAEPAHRGGDDGVADDHGAGCRLEWTARESDRRQTADRDDVDGRGADVLADTAVVAGGTDDVRGGAARHSDGAQSGRLGVDDGIPDAVGDAVGARLEERAGVRRDHEPQRAAAERTGVCEPWVDLQWLPCSDGKARPTQPGLFPLAHGVPGRVGRLRAYGNAIVPQVAAQFIAAVM